ncbi:MAG: sigma 54-interacting transcriptional regulator [Leptospiraceae bacterium]|nr:sigma 54-interacting transcriptional regulator [Leptospiraceae bacterium]
MFELLPNYFFVSSLIVALFMGHIAFYLLRIPDRSSAAFHFGMAILWSTLISVSYAISAGFYSPPMIMPRWLSILAAPLSLLHGVAFYFHFPMPLHQRAVRRFLWAGYGICIVGVAVVGMAMLEAGKVFVFNAHFWDSRTPLAQRWFSYLTLSLILVLVGVGTWRTVLEQGRYRLLLAVLTIGFATVSVIPGTLHVLNLNGLIERSTYLTTYSFLYLVGFFISIVTYINLSRDRSTIQMRIVIVTLVTILILLQGVSYLWLQQREDLYDLAARGGVLTPAYERTVERPRESQRNISHRSYTSRTDADGSTHHYVTYISRVGDQYVERGFDYLEYRRFIAHSGFFLVAITLGAYLFVLVGFRYFFRGALITPILSIIEALKSMRRHKYATRVPVHILDEVGYIAHYFNRMARSIQASRRRLARYSDSLEEKIKERTKELEATLAEYKALHETKQELQKYATDLEKRINEQDLDEGRETKELHLPGERRLVYSSRAMEAVIDRVRQIAVRQEPVLITGETGTGKELIASLIHQLGRETEPFVPVNCAAIPASLWESQIFGHSRGAFTDAKSDFPGAIAEAANGTLFFDEIGEMPLEIQPKILRFIQERKYKPIGSRSEKAVNCRLVFATHRNLREMVTEGDFREDLYYRVNVLEIRIPALRERRTDIRSIVQDLVAAFQSDGRTTVTSIDEEVMDLLVGATWAGNVRELENFMIRIMAQAQQSHITMEDIPAEALRNGSEVARLHHTPISHEDSIPEYDLAVSEYSRSLIRSALQQCSGNKSEAARILGISRGKLQSQMRTLKMDD